jgi:hypothetical protein
MNINNIQGTAATTAATGVDPIAQPAASPTSPLSGSGPAATASFSAGGQLFGELQQLSQQDPTQFKAVAAQIATTFQNAASQASGPQAQFLTHLANQFTQAAQTGTLAPPQGTPGAGGAGEAAGGHHHHHHHGGGGGGGGAAAILGSDSSDVNQAYQSALSVVAQATSSGSSS